jgi:glycosyltransferase involved in cell wall biosynthesis
MRCPRLAELPPPPAGRTGWPWTEESPARDDLDGGSPTITVVVPSYQQAAFLEETLRSVLLQGYPALELLVMDGGSKDGSVDIIRRYERWIAGWVSEKDGGQSAAINKGWRRATGELVTWLNSDDILLPGWAAEMARPFVDDAALDFAYCDVRVIDKDSRPEWLYPGLAVDVEAMAVLWKTPFAQQGFLIRRSVVEASGYVDESLHFTMDFELWLRLKMAGRKFLHVGKAMAAYRIQPDAKTWTIHDVHLRDMLEVTRRFIETAPPELRPVAERARRRRHWNAAHLNYDNRAHADARRSALRHLADDGWRALPRVTGMVALSFLGGPGHRLLALTRRLRAARGPA